MVSNEVKIPVLDYDWCMKALEEVNRLVAICFCQPVKEVTFKFVDQIDIQRKQRHGFTYTRCVMGQADYENNVVTLIYHKGWQETAVHELVHIYLPFATEKKVIELTKKVIAYLKLHKLLRRSKPREASKPFVLRKPFIVSEPPV